MGKEGTGSPHARGALPEEEQAPADEFFDVPATIVDPNAGRRAAALIAAARNFGQEVPTKESKNVAAALAEHERNLAEERRVSAQPTPTLGFDLRVDALQEIEPPARVEPRPVEIPVPVRERERPAPFDLSEATDSEPEPEPEGLPKGRGNGVTLLVIALLAGVSGFVAFRFGAARLGLSPKAPSLTAPR
jgi:hypothetical protein